VRTRLIVIGVDAEPIQVILRWRPAAMCADRVGIRNLRSSFQGSFGLCSNPATRAQLAVLSGDDPYHELPGVTGIYWDRSRIRTN
jgi:hypothetical protein